MAKPVILAVDDDPQVLRAVERDLRRRYAREYRILRADSGESALDTLGKLKLRGDPVALFLVDQRMPKMTGVEFLEQAIERYPEAKRHRRIGPRPHAPQKLDGAGWQGVTYAGYPGHGDAVNEPGRHLADARDAPVRRGRRDERAEGDAGRGRHLGELACLVYGEVGDHEPRDPRFCYLLQELLDAPREDYVVVEQEDHGHPPREH